MNNLYLYLGQACTCLLAFYGFYHLVLRKETGFQFNRAYLLLSPAFSLLLPLALWPDWLSHILFSSPADPGGPLMAAADISGGSQATAPVLPAAEPFDWGPVIWIVYGLGFVFFAYRFGRQLLRIRQQIRLYKPDIIHQDGIQLIPTRGQLPTFSFFNYLFWDSSQGVSERDKQKILHHEAVHIRQKHTWDVLYLEILSLFFWFNPVFYLYKKALTTTHEYIADAEVIRITDQQEYAILLAQQVFNQLNLSLAHYFNKSLTLRRMTMLRKNHLRPSRWKQFLVLPLLALLFCLVSARQDPDTGGMTNSQNPQDTSKGPSFPGGKAALQKYLKNNLRYPAEALHKGITGQALIQVTIDGQGQAGNFKTLQADNAYFEAEALRVIQEMPSWQPAAYQNQSLTLAFPFVFGLESNKSLPALKVPVNNSRFVLQDATTVVGYSKFIGGKTVVQKSVTPTTKPKPAAAYPRDSKVFTFVEQPATFPGGDTEMSKFIGKNLKYPAEALRNGKEGLVVVQFVVDRNGKVSDAKVVKPLGSGTDEEAIRVVGLFPDFEPAKQNGKPVEFQFTLPFRFGIAPKAPASGAIQPDKDPASGSAITAGSKAPVALPGCPLDFSFSRDGKLIEMNKSNLRDQVTVTCGKPADCPGGNFQIEKVRYFLNRNSGIVGDRTVMGNTLDLSKLLSLYQPGDNLTVYVLGTMVPGKNGQASAPFGMGTVIPLQ